MGGKHTLRISTVTFAQPAILPDSAEHLVDTVPPVIHPRDSDRREGIVPKIAFRPTGPSECRALHAWIGELIDVLREGAIGRRVGARTSKLSSFINEASPEDLSGIASLLFTRIGALEPQQQDRFVQEINRDPQAKRVFEKMQAYSR